MSQYRGWRRTSPKLDYAETRFGINMANHRAEFGVNWANNEYGVRRAQINADYDARNGTAWPIQQGLYHQEGWGQWGIRDGRFGVRDSRVRLAQQGIVDSIFARY